MVVIYPELFISDGEILLFYLVLTLSKKVVLKVFKGLRNESGIILKF